MSLALLNFGEYSIYVWPAFFFTFVIFFTIYQITRKELRKVEKIYLSNFSNKYIKVNKTSVNKHGKVLIGTLTS
tara:strand:- start:1222 stop:1443 length:222 start_codon:yes stop_codon:yes gene_type:complete